MPNRCHRVEDYLRGQGRYRHRFEPTYNAEAMAQLQAQVAAYWSEVAETTRPRRW